MKNKVTEILGCKYPIVQGAIGVICNPELAAIVSAADGFGLLATALTEGTKVFREQITRKPCFAIKEIRRPKVSDFVPKSIPPNLPRL